MNLYSYDLGDEADEEADQLHRLRHQVPVAGRQGHRLRERRLHLPVRPRHGEGRRRCRSRSPRTSAAAAAGAGRRQQAASRTTRSRPTASRALFGARGDVFTVPGEVRPDAQPHADARRPRAQLEVVARRQVDRLHLRRDRRGRDLDRRRRTASGAAGAADHGRRQLQVPARLVARQQEDPLVRREAAAAVRRRRDEGGDAGRRSRTAFEITRLRLVAGQQVDRLREARRRGHAAHLPLLARVEADDRRSPTAGSTRREPGVQRRRQVPVLRVGRAASTRPTARPSSSTSTATCRGSTSSRWRRTRKRPFAPKSDEVKIKEEPKPPSRPKRTTPKARPPQAKPKAKKDEPKKAEPKKDAGASRSTSTASRTASRVLPIAAGQLPAV